MRGTTGLARTGEKREATPRGLNGERTFPAATDGDAWQLSRAFVVFRASFPPLRRSPSRDPAPPQTTMSAMSAISVHAPVRVTRRGVTNRATAVNRAGALQSVTRVPALRNAAAFRPALRSRRLHINANAVPATGDALPPPAVFNVRVLSVVPHAALFHSLSPASIVWTTLTSHPFISRHSSSQPKTNPRLSPTPA